MSEQLLTEKQIKIIIPECCRLGLDSCTHVTPKPQKKKKNIGL